MPLNIKALREEFSKLHGEATAVIETAATENRELKDDEKAENEKRFNRISQIKQTLDENARFAALALNDAPAGEGDNDEGEEGEGNKPTVQFGKDAPGRKEFEAGQGRHSFKGEKIDREEFSHALSVWLNTGEMERKFAAVTSATSGGVIMPKGVMNPIVATAPNVFREAYQLYGMSPVSTPGTNDLSLPVIGVSIGSTLAEDATASAENEPSLSESIDLSVSQYESGEAWFSNLMIQANDFDVLSYAEGALSYAKELKVESAAVASFIADSDITQIVTTDTTSGITYDNLVDLNRKLPKRYDRLKVILLGAAAFSAAEKLVGDDGHPVLNTDPQNQQLKRFNGTPVLRSDYFDAFGASKVIGGVISMIGFALRDAAGPGRIERYRAVPGRPNQTGMNMFGFHGYGWAPSAVAKLKTPAS